MEQDPQRHLPQRRLMPGRPFGRFLRPAVHLRHGRAWRSDDAGDGPRPDPAKDYRTIQGHCHGDPFPLPLFGEVLARGGHAGPATRSRVRCVREAIWSLNALDAPSRALRAHQPTSGRRLSETQRSIIQRVSQRIENYGERPDMTASDAFAALIKSQDLYSGQPINLKPYDSRLLKVLHRNRQPQDLRGCLGPEGRRYLDQADDLIFRSEAELDALQDRELIQPITPYWDPVLRHNRKARIDFIKRLHAVGLVGFRLAIRGRIGAFCVGKKDGSLRLVLDGREPSSLHRRPPHTALGSAGALAGLDLSDQDLAAAGVDPASADIHAAGLDLKDGFYQFADDYIADWFGFDFPEPAEVFGNPLVCQPSDGRLIAVSGDTRIFAVFRGLMIGWSWSLFFLPGPTRGGAG